MSSKECERILYVKCCPGSASSNNTAYKTQVNVCEDIKNKLVEIKIIWQTFSHLPQQWNPLVCYRVRRHRHLPAKVAANLTSCLYSSAVHMAVFLFFPRLQKQLTFSGLSSLKCFAQSEQLLRRAQDVSFFNLGPFQTCTFFLKKKKKNPIYYQTETNRAQVWRSHE